MAISDTDQSMPQFATTHWSVVLAAGQQVSPHAEGALAKLCGSYWYPLYAFVRRRGYDAHEAQDLTQAFFVRLLEKNYLGTADRQRGRFRSFLVGALKHFLDNEWDKAQTLKRGGKVEFVPLDDVLAEKRYGQEPFHDWTPERIFERRWALTLMEEVMRKLNSDYAKLQKSELFNTLEVYLTGESGLTCYAGAARQLNMSEGAVKVAVHRLRRRYGELLRAEIAQTVASPGDVEDEIRHLFAALG